MTSATAYRMAFTILFLAMFTMRFYFMVKVKRSGGRLTPDKKAVAREGGIIILLLRIVAFCGLIAFLVMYFFGVKWIDALAFFLPAWLRWAGFVLGLLTTAFWTWTQAVLDTQWSAQLQLTHNHKLITTGPYTYIRHPLYASIFVWCLSLSLLSANWIFVAVGVLSIGALLWRVPREEQMMLEAFGDEYREYMQRTGRFLPTWKRHLK